MSEVTKETVQAMADKISHEGMTYWLENYARVQDDGTDLDEALKEAVQSLRAINNFAGLLDRYMEKFDVEFS